jgi:anti-sigma factor RsiW
MTHATDGLLQEYLDGEIDSTAAAELRDHLARCAVCASELSELERVGSSVHDALALLEAAPPMVRAQASISAARSGRTVERPARHAGTGRRSFAKAAMLLLALAGAGAAAIPESPVRRALETTLARVAQLFGTAEAPATDVPATVAPAADAPLAGGMGVLPADGRIRVVLQAPAGEVNVHVQLVNTPRAHIATATEGDEGVRFRTAPGRLEVTGLTTGNVVIRIPRSAQHATVEVGGQVYVYKQGGALHLSGPAGTDRGEQVDFRIGT